MDLGTLSNLSQGVSAACTVFAFIPAIVLFYRNQRKSLAAQQEQLEIARDRNHRYVIEQYREFLGICLRYPEISLESGSPIPDLDDRSRLRRDIAFDVLTSTFERAYITYIIHKDRSDPNQWRGWDAYMQEYCERPDYQEWIRRVLFGNSPSRYLAEGSTQYDARFEEHFFGKIRPFFAAVETGPDR